MENKSNPKRQKRKKWLKFRHKVVKFLLRYTLGVFCKIKYRISIKPLGEKNERQYLVLYNHQTAFDQFFVGVSFKKPVYYVASEDLFSMGFLSKLIKYLVEPIPIKKQTTDVKAVLNCMRVAKEGGTIAIAPEGNRTYSGKTEYIKPSIVSLVRALKIPVAFYKIEGGYGVHPRWSDKVRRGKMQSYVSRILEVDEIAELSDDELLSVIKSELYQNEGRADAEFLSAHQAEHLERAIYVCPECGISEFESNADVIKCKHCGLAVKHNPNKTLVGINRSFPFAFVTEWYDYQSEFVNNFDSKSNTDTHLYTEKTHFSEVMLYKKKHVLEKEVSLSLYGDRVEVKGEISGSLTFCFDEISAVVVLGKNKLNIYHGGRLYQFKGDKRFCALKYVNLYYRYKNLTSNEEHEEFFLGV